ncbi:E3 ubiquitin-protein ligase Ubr3 [Frankliniella fusca]|uniref:E3 ubiquitin-protein ligase Ubr3 n=1 Tax=Frankliniella fusca TaxID=407009 RepID=A0AAE1HSI2_9NEOP|nr:E3 ubiquitin-protein ligase Ubr3 [Frankliniella fusca]
MEPKLREFYFGCYLQELASPRFPLRHKYDDIRERVTLNAEIHQKRMDDAEAKKRRAEERRLSKKTKK